MDPHKNFAYSTVLTAPSPATSGTSLIVQSGEGARFAVGANATVCPVGVNPTPLNSEIVRITGIATDTFTITRTQESTSARTVIVGDAIWQGPTAKTFTDIEGSMQTFGDADVTIVAGTTVLGTTAALTAKRTVTLPAASAVSAGRSVLVGDFAAGINISGVTMRCLHVIPAGGDTLTDPNQPTTIGHLMTGPGVSARFISDGTSKWLVAPSDDAKIAGFASYPNNINVPSGIWTPLPWGNGYANTDPYGIWPQPSAATTIAAGSNSVALPTATINVASTTGFSATGFCAITIGGNDTVFAYTGKTGTSFTGCNLSPNVGIATGTMLTGQAVTQVCVECQLPAGTGYCASVVEAAWAANATGYRGIRQKGGGFAGYSTNWPALNIANQTIQACAQMPGVAGSTGVSRVEVFQNSGSALLCNQFGIEAPGWSIVYMASEAR